MADYTKSVNRDIDEINSFFLLLILNKLLCLLPEAAALRSVRAEAGGHAARCQEAGQAGSVRPRPRPRPRRAAPPRAPGPRRGGRGGRQHRLLQEPGQLGPSRGPG